MTISFDAQHGKSKKLLIMTEFIASILELEKQWVRLNLLLDICFGGMLF